MWVLFGLIPMLHAHYTCISGFSSRQRPSIQRSFERVASLGCPASVPIQSQWPGHPCWPLLRGSNTRRKTVLRPIKRRKESPLSSMPDLCQRISLRGWRYIYNSRHLVFRLFGRTAWVLRTYIKCTQHCSKGNCTLSVSLETRLSVLDFVSALQKIRAETNLERKTWVCGYPQLSHHVGGQWNTTLTHNSTKEVDPGFCSGCLHRVFQRRGHDQQPVQSLQLWH